MRARILINKGLKKQVRFARIKGLDEHMFDSRVPRRSVIYPRIFGDAKISSPCGSLLGNTRLFFVELQQSLLTIGSGYFHYNLKLLCPFFKANCGISNQTAEMSSI